MQLFFSFLLSLFSISLVFKEIQVVQLRDTADMDPYVSQEFRKLFTNFSRRIRPNYSGNATIVKVDMTVLKFGNLNEKDMTFLVDIFLRQEWQDNRLRHNLKTIIIPFLGRKIPSDYIWTPDTHIINAIKATKHAVTVNNEKWNIYPDGTVFWGTRVTAVAGCSMDFHKYPMDVQNCGIAIESYAYPKKHVVYQWYNRGVFVLQEEMAQFTLTDVGNVTHEKKMYDSCIGVTTLLTICYIWGSVNRRLPRVDYVKAIDIYFIVSFCFILCTIIEFAVVLQVSVRDNEKKDEKQPLRRKGAIRRRKSRTTFSIAGENPFFVLPDDSRGSLEADRNKQECIPMRKLNHENESKRRLSFTVNRRKNSVFVNEYSGGRRASAYSFFDPANNDDHDMAENVKQDNSPTWFEVYPVPIDATTLDVVSRIMFPFAYFVFNLIFWVTFRSGSDQRGDAVH